ncbi:MAG: type III ribulose-bisphosphate carboxylase [Nanoarchaeota archaeon]|nr:type III ribulose-bisphosphate carboxylase [Nanoarchaeota archaeon]
MKSYIDTKYKPTSNDLIAEFTVHPKDITVKKAANHIAGESSIDTWSDIQTLSKAIVKRLKPSVFYIKKNTIKIAYPSALFEMGNIPQIMSSVAGNIFGMKMLKTLRLEDIHFPKKIIKSFKGPRFGIEGIRKLLNVKERPLLGTIIKPKIGLNSKQHANLALQSWIGGVDIVKDDENLTNQTFNKFKDRVKLTLKARNKAEIITGERKVYMPNITAETNEMLKRMDYIRSMHGRYAMIDILTTGWSGLQTVRDHSNGLVLHAHRAGHAAFTKGNNGISMLTIAKIARLIGVDQIHVGAIFGKMTGSKKEVKHIGEEIEDRFVNEKPHVLAQKWYNIKPTFPVCSGGLHPGLIHPLIDAMGHNVIIQLGGGIHAHPNGTLAGAIAARKALEASFEGIPLKQAEKDYKELEIALKKWKH